MGWLTEELEALIQWVWGVEKRLECKVENSPPYNF
jgi:hypothetical protein